MLCFAKDLVGAEHAGRLGNRKVHLLAGRRNESEPRESQLARVQDRFAWAAERLAAVAVTPLSEALLNFTAPRKVMGVTFAGLAIVAVGGVIVIPRFGVTGAASVIVIARLVIGSAVVFLASRVSSRASIEAGSLDAQLPGRLEE